MIIAPYSKSSGQNIDGLSNSTTADGQSPGDMVLPPLGHSEVADVLEINANLSQEIISYVSLVFFLPYSVTGAFQVPMPRDAPATLPEPIFHLPSDGIPAFLAGSRPRRRSATSTIWYP
jgi:hypothetical protein